MLNTSKSEVPNAIATVRHIYFYNSVFQVLLPANLLVRRDEESRVGRRCDALDRGNAGDWEDVNDLKDLRHSLNCFSFAQGSGPSRTFQGTSSRMIVLNLDGKTFDG